MQKKSESQLVRKWWAKLVQIIYDNLLALQNEQKSIWQGAVPKRHNRSDKMLQFCLDSWRWRFITVILFINTLSI